MLRPTYGTGLKNINSLYAPWNHHCLKQQPMDPMQKSSKISKFIQMQGAFPKISDNPTQEKENSFFKMFLAR
jgi:hypothetical protein